MKVHHSGKVKDWLSDHIEVFHRPSDSPELNPDERLNADLEEVVTKRAPARSKAHLKRGAISHSRKLQRLLQRVRAYSQNKPVRYAA